MNDARRNELRRSLGTYGADISRWPQQCAPGALEALMSVPEIRRAWEDERVLDRAMGELRRRLDGEIGSGALGRIRRRTLARLPANAIAWRRVAAAVLVAGMMGGATDLFLAEPAADTTDIVMLDPLSGIDETEFQ